MVERPKDVRTHFEAGVALLYGEIGALLDRVESLKDFLPNQVTQARNDLNRSVVNIAKAAKALQALSDSQELKLVQVLKSSEFKAAVSEAVRSCERVEKQDPKHKYLIIFGVGLFIGLICGFGANFFL